MMERSHLTPSSFSTSVTNTKVSESEVEVKLDTKGLCFICLEQISPLKVTTATHFHPLRPLLRHLDINLGQVFASLVPGNGLSTVSVLPKMEKTEVKVSLCGRCGGLEGKFSELFKMLEMLQMEVNDKVGRIRRLLKEAEENQRLNGRYRELMTSDIHSITTFPVVERLRKALQIKCEFDCL